MTEKENKDYLIRCGDLFWGPNRRGYTNSILSAGLYTKKEAEDQQRSRAGDKAVSIKEALEQYPPNPEMVKLLVAMRLQSKVASPTMKAGSRSPSSTTSGPSWKPRSPTLPFWPNTVLTSSSNSK